MKKRSNWFLNIRFRRIIYITLSIITVFSIFSLITEETRETNNLLKSLENIEGVDKTLIDEYLTESKLLDLSEPERRSIVEYRLKYNREHEEQILIEIEKLEFILLMSIESNYIENEKYYIKELISDYSLDLLKNNVREINTREFNKNIEKYKTEILKNYNGLLLESSKYTNMEADTFSESDIDISLYNLKLYKLNLLDLYNKYEKHDNNFIMGEDIKINEVSEISF